MELHKIFDQLKKYRQQHYNDKLDIKSSKGSQWTLHYRQGQIVWVTGGNHPYRRWRRYMTQNCPQLDIDRLILSFGNISENYWDYHLLETLYKTQQIPQEQANAIILSTIAEVLFDIAQESTHASLSYQRQQDLTIKTPIIRVGTSTYTNTYTKWMQDSWKNWLEAGLGSFSPDLAPFLRRPRQLQMRLNPSLYKNFENLFQGQYTLRDLAVKMKQSILTITRSLLPYIREEIIDLIEVPDLPLLVTQVKSQNHNRQPITPDAPLIACIDDSPQVCKMLGQIIASQGLRFIKIQDPVQALPILIQSKPDLIFLDLIMPVASGYEVCAQLRRSSVLANVPVVILTGSDGLFDKVRSKVFGATDFITKPVEIDKVLAAVDKHLKVISPVEDISGMAFSFS